MKSVLTAVLASLAWPAFGVMLAVPVCLILVLAFR